MVSKNILLYIVIKRKEGNATGNDKVIASIQPDATEREIEKGGNGQTIVQKN